jgi:OmpR-family two-component system manganese-sensing response regulator
MIASPQVEKLVTQETDKSAPRRILCVEDDRDTCEVLRFVMTDYDFTTVSSVAAAEELIRSQKFEIYVLDNWLPDGSGVDLCEKIRQLGSTSPIVFTSAVGQRHDIELAMNAGADRYLVKPYEPETLVRTVKELLNQSSELAFES